MISNEKKTWNNSDKTVFFDDEVQPQISLIVDKAAKSVTFVTPYLQLWRHLQIKIEDAICRGVAVRFILRTESLENGGQAQTTWSERKKIESLDWLLSHHVQVHKVDGLHAKIYINESEVLISSMNITEPSTNNSLEFAMLIRSPSDARQFRDYADKLIKNAQPTIITKHNEPPRLSKAKERNDQRVMTGNCIRCGSNITLNMKKPLCSDCYSTWSEYGNPDYQEKYCHSCGKPAPVTLNKPLCKSCYRSYV